MSPARLAILSLAALACQAARAGSEYEQAPIFYSETQPRDAAYEMEQLMRAGKLTLDRRSAWSVLHGVLRQFRIPVESQVMVFSKTSKQNDLISPRTPRVIYFTDDAYVGYSVGGSLEVSTIDPRLGPVFYLMDQHEDPARPLTFQRDQSCLSCHGGTFTPEVPGVLVRSVFPGPEGHPIMSQGSTVVGTSTPFPNRWGGWYVTGSHGSLLHRGNVTATERPDNTCDMPVEKGANVTDLAAFFDTSPYPRKKSDIVALMVLEHQTSVQNVLTKASHTALRAMHMQTCLQKELGEPVQPRPTGTARRIIDHCADDVLDALLFRDEAALPDGGIDGDEDFQTAFTAGAPRSSDGRSLKDFQLRSRLFKYRCSYMIHGITFRHLQPDLKETVLTRLRGILTGTADAGPYAVLSASERAHILRILQDTGILPRG